MRTQKTNGYLETPKKRMVLLHNFLKYTKNSFFLGTFRAVCNSSNGKNDKIREKTTSGRIGIFKIFL